MSSQIQITGETKVKSLTGVLVGTSGVVSSLNIDGSLGIPQLDVNGKIIVSQLPNSVMEYKGTWDASTNTPTLVNGTGNQGDVYLCSVAGTVNFGAGAISFVVSDQVIYSGSIWQKASGSNGTVTSVAITESGDSLNITGSPITTSGTINIGFNGTNLQYVNGAGNLTTFPTLISSIGLSMPSAFSVANSPLTANGTIAVTGAGYPSQYIRGDGTLADFPTSGGGGSSVSYYLNGGTSQGTIGGVTYYEMSKTADTGTMADFSLTGNGFIVAFLTDAGDPAQLNIPAGNWNYEIYASMSANGGTPEMYAELYKYDGTTFTLIATSPHEILYDGTALNLYTFAMTVPSTTLAITDRLAVKLYATNSGGKTTTVHTQDSHLCQIITTFSTGITALNGLTAQVQYFATGTSGTDFNISSTTATHTFNIPDASASARGLITTGTQTIGGAKTYNNTAIFESSGGTGLKYGASISKGFTPFTFSNLAVSIYSDATTNNVIFRDNLSSAKLLFDNSTQTYTFPAASGTIALTSSLSSYVPYSGATGSVDLGAYGLTAAGVIANNFYGVGNGVQGGYIYLKQGTTPYAGLLGSNGISADGTKFLLIANVDASNNKSALLELGSLTNNTTRTFTLPDLSGTLALLEGTQTFTGVKTFDEGISLKSAAFPTPATGYSSIGGNSFGITIITKQSSTIYTSNLGFPAANRTFTFPNSDGTIALTSDLSSYVPYNGATASVNIGAFSLLSSGFLLNQSGSASLVSGYTTIRPQTGSGIYGFIIDNGNTGINQQLLFNNAASYIYTFPSATGILALGTGTTNYHAKWTGTNTIGNSLIWDNGTNVGIGNTNTSYTLDVSGTGRFTSSLIATQATFTSTANTYAGGALILKQVGGTNPIYLTSVSGYFALSNGGSTDHLLIASTGAATFSSSVQAGSSSATNYATLQIMGASTSPSLTTGTAANVVFAMAAGQELAITANGTAPYGVNFQARNSLAGGGGSGTSYPIIFNPLGGNVLIGTTTDSATTGVGSKFVSLGRLYTVSSLNDNTQESLSMYSTGSSAYRFYVGWGGTVYATNTTISAISDIRFKENIQDIDLGLDAILALKPRKFDWKEGKGKNIKNDRGFIAQEFEQIFPDLIDEWKDPSPEGEEPYKSVRQDLIPILVKAIQEQQIQIQNLQEQINILAK